MNTTVFKLLMIPAGSYVNPISDDSGTHSVLIWSPPMYEPELHDIRNLILDRLLNDRD